MSRIGRKPVIVPDKVKVESKGRSVHVEGPLGKLDAILPEGVTVKVEKQTDRTVALVGAPRITRVNRGFQGLMRAMLANMVYGVTQGYEKTLEITGVGYKAELKGDKLTLALGFTHPVEVTIPKGVTCKIDKQTIITIKGADRQVVGQLAAQIRGFKKPEPYKGKGVKYSTEVVRRKVGKTGAK